MCFIVVCTLIDNDYASLLFSQTFFVLFRRSEHAHASYPGFFFSPARVQPLYGAGRKESSGTGLVFSLIYISSLVQNFMAQ